jgi:hypothetical protein
MSKLLAAAFSLLSLTTIACAGQTADDAPGAPAGDEASSQGLALTVQTADRVEGTFLRDGHTLAFLLSTTEAGHLALLSDQAGNPLVETTFEGGIEDSSLLGGKLRLKGPVDAAEPASEGDPRTLEELIADLKDALRTAGVDPSFFSVSDPSAPGGASPGLVTKKWLQTDGNWHLNCGEYNDFPTWTFWGWTTIELRPEVGYSTASAAVRVLTPWYNPTEYTGVFSGVQVVKRQYAGYNVRVSNNTVTLNGVCSRPLRARVY